MHLIYGRANEDWLYQKLPNPNNLLSVKNWSSTLTHLRFLQAYVVILAQSRMLNQRCDRLYIIISSNNYFPCFINLLVGITCQFKHRETSYKRKLLAKRYSHRGQAWKHWGKNTNELTDHLLRWSAYHSLEPHLKICTTFSSWSQI